MQFNECSKFQADYKRLAKKYDSLAEALKTFRAVLSVRPRGSKHSRCLTQTDDAVCLIKSRLFCRTLKGSSLRILYAYSVQEDVIEFMELGSQAGSHITRRTKRTTSAKKTKKK